MTESDLLARYANGQDAEAFRSLVERHAGMVFATCRRILGNAADAEDAAQDCFILLARHAAKPATRRAGKLRAPISGWLHQVAVRVAIDRRRASERRRHRELQVARIDIAREPTWDDIKAAADEAIARLPERIRIPIVMHYLEGRSQAQIAEELGVTQSAVSKRLHRGVELLRKHLRKAGILAPAVALASLLTAHAAEAAPPSLVTSLGKMALVGIDSSTKIAGVKLGAIGATIGGISMMKIGVISTVAAVAVVTAGVVAHNALSQNFQPVKPSPIAAPPPPAEQKFPATPSSSPSFTYYDYAPILQYCDDREVRLPTPDEAADLGVLMPQVPWRQNAAYYYSRAAWMANQVAQQRAYPKGSISTDQAYLGDKKDFLEWAKMNDSVMAAMRDGLPLAICLCPPVMGQNRDDPKQALPPLMLLSSWRELARRCADVAFAEELDGRFDEAAETYLGGVHMGTQVSRRGMMILKLIGSAMTSIATTGLERLVANRPLTDNTLRRIIAECCGCESLPSQSARVWEYECAYDKWTFVRTKSGAAWLDSRRVADREGFMNVLSGFHDEVAHQLHKPLPEILSPSNGLEAGMQKEIDKGSLTGEYFSAFVKPLILTATQQGKQDLSLRAIELRAALALYERLNHKLPTKLDELVPDLLPIVPEDPFAGQPLKYARVADGWKIWSIGDDLHDNGGVMADENQPLAGPDYVFLSRLETNEQGRRNVRPGAAAHVAPKARTNEDFKNDIAALKNTVWKKDDPIQKNLAWYALNEGLAIADSQSKEVGHLTELVGETDFVVNGIAFGKDKVWLGTNKGLFAWDRKELFWTRFAVGGTIVDAPVSDLTLSDDGILHVTARDADGRTMLFEYDTRTGSWGPTQ